ncbi:alpha-tocopherol transfer protein-like [Trichonephila inaurata madagascariensis]|uniref:Alpha-tocopherol transfer protein-like n=1 Tax=Trichonephila inaurata madagascariensis TaxID=2747483 RepID=A0A8X6YYY5_9ARAC|nr:alpha-tocopherol transfer protein-like [Trichonephila inaurata madagascariensis]
MATKYEEIMKAKGFLPYNLHTLPAKFIQKAKEELGETDEIRVQALEQFRKRILEDKKLKMCVPTDDTYLLQFLRARKYDVDKAIGLVHNYFNLIISHPEIFDQLDKEKMFKFSSSGFVNVLPFRDNDGCLVLTIRMGTWDPEEIKVQLLFCTMAAVIYSFELYPANQICGVRIIFDSEGYSFKQMRCFVPRYIPLIAKALRNCIPARFKSIHVVNEAIVFHSLPWNNMEEIHKYISKEVLPQEYGGDYTSYNDGDSVTKEIDKTYDMFSMLVRTCFSLNGAPLMNKD